MAGFCKNIDVTIHIDNSVTVIDDGRGIPTQMHTGQKRSAAEVALTVLHAGGKFDSDVYKVSGGLHGVGVSVVNALSEWLELEIKQNGKVFQQRYERGGPLAPLAVAGTTTTTGTKITFKPDYQIFEDREYSYDILSQRLRELAFLNRGLKISIQDERSSKKQTFFYEGGIASFIEYLNKNKTSLHPAPIYLSKERDGIFVEIAFQYNDSYVEQVFSFANNINTQEGGTHLIGFQGGAYAHRERVCGLQRSAEERRRGAIRRGCARRSDGGRECPAAESRSSKARPRPSWATARSRASSKPW